MRRDKEFGKHKVSERLSKKLAEVAARKRKEAQASAPGPDDEYYRWPHKVSDRLQQKLEENRARVQERKQRERLDAERSIEAAVTEHHTILSRNLRKAIVKNEYGAVVKDNRTAEVSRFLTSLQVQCSALSAEEAVSLVLELTERLDEAGRRSDFDLSSYPENGYEFELWLAEALERFGWEASVTSASGDQGVDLIARKGDLDVAIQAKRYSGKVGNKAIQEVYSGAKHLGVPLAAVVTTIGFTPNARALAETTGVKLLHVEELPELENLLRA